MDIVCDQCSGKFKIPDEKVPKGQMFSISCPKCHNKISIDAREKPAASPEKEPLSTTSPESSAEKTIFDEVESGSYNAAEKPFDFLEEGVKTALLCEPDSDVRGTIRSALDNLGYQTTEPKSAREVLKQMRFHIFDMVVLNETFDTRDPDMNNILRYLQQLGMGDRRNIFVALITNRFRTMDNMMAFNKSVNLIVNLKNIDDIEKILKRGVTDNELFYRIFKEALVKVGKV